MEKKKSGTAKDIGIFDNIFVANNYSLKENSNKIPITSQDGINSSAE